MAKGGDFEREISKYLSRWWTYGERDDVFWRTSASGGRATVRAADFIETKYGYGDITFTDPIAKPMLELLVIEAKRGYTNTSKRIKAADMSKLCNTIYDVNNRKRAKAAIQRLFSKTKKQGGVDLLDMIDSKVAKHKLTLAQWILKGEVDRAQAGLPYFILIGRRDNREAFVLMPNDLLARLEMWQTPSLSDKAYKIILDVGIDKYFMTNCDHFFKWLVPETVIELAKQQPYRRFV